MEEGLEEAGTGFTARNRPRRQLRGHRGPATWQASAQAARRAQEGGELDDSTSPHRPGRVSKVLVWTESAWNIDGTMPL